MSLAAKKIGSSVIVKIRLPSRFAITRDRLRRFLGCMATELLFKTTVFFCAFLPSRYILFVAILVRKAFAKDLADQHVKFFLGDRLHDNLDKWLHVRFVADHFNEVAYFLLLTNKPSDLLRQFDKINWFDSRPFFTNRVAAYFDRLASGYSMDAVARLHKFRWSDGPVDRQFTRLLILMLEHRIYSDYEERSYWGRIELNRLKKPDDINQYVAYFFRDKDLVRSLARELALRGVEEIIAELDANGQYWEGFTEDLPDRVILQEISLFYALRHLTLHTYHGGEGYLVPQLCKTTLATQERLRRTLPKPSPELTRELAKAGIEDLSQVKLLSPDWSALIGHNGHLNVHLMMREMNWWKGKPLLLAYKDRIANRPFLDLFSHICPTLILGDNVDSSVWRELASLTPFLGVSHQIFEFDDGRAMYWNDAGGLAVETWDAQDKGFPLRDIYDQRALSNPGLEETFHALKQRWGFAPTDWFVCLHMRDAATRGDTHGAGESIRNTSFDNYESAVRYITNQGGWVVRMGSPKVTPLPKMQRVIDYARDPGQSPEMDIHLVRHARMFIGTTSGFAYVASSFGIPTAMVNAISSVGLLWSKDTRFALKPVHTREGRLLTQREVTSEKWRWSFPTFETLAYAGLQLSESSSDEILETVREVLDLTAHTGNSQSVLSDSEIKSWKAQVEVPGFYGSSLPSAYFLEKYRHNFLDQS